MTEVPAIATTAAVICSVLVAAGCAGSGPKQTAHYTTPPETTDSGVSFNSPRVEQIQLAHSSSPLFSIFPAVPGTKACLILAGGPRPGHLHGTCRTVVRPARTHEPAIIVSFTETWRYECRSMFCPVVMPLHHTWTIVEGAPVSTPGARLHILARRQSGFLAPQLF